MQPSRIPVLIAAEGRFTPVPLKARHDGWTPARQIRFIDALAATRSIASACRAVGMGRVSAYKLRDHPEAAEFRAAWAKALEPDFTAERRRSPRALQRLRRLEKRRKVYEAEETHGRPNSPASTQLPSSPLTILETLLDRIRSGEARHRDLDPGSVLSCKIG